MLSADVQGASGYLSQGDPRLHFGLDGEAAYQHIDVRWPDGTHERFPGGQANQVVVVKHGAGDLTPEKGQR